MIPLKMAAGVATDAMWTNACQLMRVTAHAVQVAERAGSIVKSVVRSGKLGTIEKTGAADLQTEADRAAQYCIRHSLATQFGARLRIIGEEDIESETSGQQLEHNYAQSVLQFDHLVDAALRAVTIDDLVVWVDPVDGTKEFEQGARENSSLLEQVTVLIGIGQDSTGAPIAGVVHQPFYNFAVDRPFEQMGRTLWAVRGCGVHGSELRKPTAGKRTLVTTRSHGTRDLTDTIEALAQAGLVDEVLKVGGAGYKVLRLLDGDHAYVFSSIGCKPGKKWDTAAPEAILTEAGGRLTDCHGSALRYSADVQHMNSAGVVATGVGVDHDEYIRHIPEHVKQKLIAKL